MPTAPLNGIDLFYDIHGEGLDVVLAHGVGGNHAIWYHQVAVLAQSYRVVTFDHRGFGHSTDPDGSGRSGFVDDLEALLDYLGLEKVILVGQSMGGGTCLGLTCRRPERVSALVLADTIQGLDEPDDVRDIMMRARAETASSSQIERVMGQTTLHEAPHRAVLYEGISSFNATDRHTLRGAFGDLRTPGELAATKVPILFIVGLEDVLCPPDAVRALQAHVPGSFLVEIAGAGHSAYLERPTEFNDSVLTFLAAMGLNATGRSAHSNAVGDTARSRTAHD